MKEMFCEMEIYEIVFEGKVIIDIVCVLLEDVMLFVSNSMLICDIDLFFFILDKNIYVMVNCGVNGIDGIILIVLGVSVICDLFVLVIGDLLFYYDLNGLLVVKLYELNIIIVVVNNDGGGIFLFLL